MDNSNSIDDFLPADQSIKKVEFRILLFSSFIYILVGYKGMMRVFYLLAPFLTFIIIAVDYDDIFYSDWFYGIWTLSSICYILLYMTCTYKLLKQLQKDYDYYTENWINLRYKDYPKHHICNVNVGDIISTPTGLETVYFCDENCFSSYNTDYICQSAKSKSNSSGDRLVMYFSDNNASDFKIVSFAKKGINYSKCPHCSSKTIKRSVSGNWFCSNCYAFWSNDF